MDNFFTENIKQSTFRTIERKTFDDYYEEIKKDVKSNALPDINPVELAIKESTLNKMIFKPLYTDELRKLASRYHNRSIRNEAQDSAYLYRDSVLNINKIDTDLTIEESLPLIASIRQELGENFFGIILHENGKSTTDSINPLNPLIAVTLKNMIEKGKSAYLTKKYSIIVYALKKNNDVDSFKGRKGKKNMEQDIEALMIAPNLSKGISEQYGNFSRHSETTAVVDLVLKDRNGNNVGRTSTHTIVPIQIANQGGLMYPSYGAVLFNGSNAMNITPFLSANVGEPGGSGSTWSNVCTGSLNSSTDTGKKSLNHSNNTSPLNRRNIGLGAYDWSQICADMAIQLLVGKIEEPEEVKRMSLKQFQEKNPGTTTKDFVAYIRELNEKELPEW